MDTENMLDPQISAGHDAIDAQVSAFFKVGGWRPIWAAVVLGGSFALIAALVVSRAGHALSGTSEWGEFRAITIVEAGMWGIAIPLCHNWHEDLKPLSAVTYDRRDASGVAAYSYRIQSLLAAILTAVVLLAAGIAMAKVLDREMDSRQLFASVVVTVLGGIAWYHVILVLRACYVLTRFEPFRPSHTGITNLVVTIGVYRLLENRLRSVLALVSVLMTALVVGAGALARAANAAPATVEVVGVSGVLLFGIALTSVVALVYVPPSIRLAGVRQMIIDGRFPLDAPDHHTTVGADELTTTLESRSKLASELGDPTQGVGALRAGIVVVGPLVAGVLSTFLRTP
jgi:hypothetical protein